MFSLISRHPRAARDSQPPPPNKLSEGGWELKGWRQIRKNVERDEENEIRGGSA